MRGCKSSDSQYGRFACSMEENYVKDYKWEALEVTTHDDYILTLFHVWNPGKLDNSKPPVLF